MAETEKEPPETDPNASPMAATILIETAGVALVLQNGATGKLGPVIQIDGRSTVEETMNALLDAHPCGPRYPHTSTLRTNGPPPRAGSYDRRLQKVRGLQFETVIQFHAASSTPESLTWQTRRAATTKLKEGRRDFQCQTVNITVEMTIAQTLNWRIEVPSLLAPFQRLNARKSVLLPEPRQKHRTSLL